jgi:4-hydroxybenzoate polyprenyltransferase
MGRLPLILFLATIAGAVLYSVPPIRLKRLPLVSSLTLSAICASAMIYGLALLPNYHVRNLLPENLPLVFALAFPLALQVKDLRDYAGDQSQRTWTLPTVLGPRIGRAVAAVLSAAGFLLIGPLTAQPVLAAVGAATAALVGGAAWLGKYERATQLAIAGCVILLALYLWLLPQN